MLAGAASAAPGVGGHAAPRRAARAGVSAPAALRRVRDGADAGDRRRRGVRVGHLALFPARPVRMVGGDRARADGDAGVLRRRGGARPLAPRRHRRDARHAAAGMAAVRGARRRLGHACSCRSACCATSSMLLLESTQQTTPIGLPQAVFVLPVVLGSAFLALFGARARAASRWNRQTIVAGLVVALLIAAVVAPSIFAPAWAPHAVPCAADRVPAVPRRRRADRVLAVDRRAAVLHRRADAADPHLRAAGRGRRRPFRAAVGAVLRARRPGDGSQRHVVAADRAAAALVRPAARRSQPHHGRGDGVLLRHLRLEARRRRRRRRHPDAGDPQDEAGPQRGDRVCSPPARSWRRRFRPAST